MSTTYTPGPEFANEAYQACLHGTADRVQQQSAASQIILLHARKGEMLEALEAIADHYDMDDSGPGAWKKLALEMAETARAAIARATGAA